ncbi:hypothetical protein Btru_020918 [Bulinus truncatus]|nr:hypothetical protein Btru_020918 [Bulinus truncatus]
MSNTESDADMAAEDETRWIEETKSWYISDEVMEYLDLSLTITVHGIFSVAGVVSNIVNVVIFVKLGLKDSMSIGLLTLSLTDLAVTVLQLASCCSYLVKLVIPDSPVDPWFLGGYIFSWSRYVAYLISCWITTVIAVERCFCVVSPFTVRQMFTRTRCVAVLLAICLFHVCIHLPVFIYARVEWTRQSLGLDSSPDNETLYSDRYVLTVVFNGDSARWEMLSDMIAGISLSVLSQVILLICTLWMIYSLKASSKIRMVKDQNRATEKDARETSDKDDATLSPKERRLVKVVLFMAVNLSACNVPRFVTIAVHHILPGMNLGAYQNLDTVFWEISYIFGTICCTTNTLVYFKLNSKYRRVFKTMTLFAFLHLYGTIIYFSKCITCELPLPACHTQDLHLIMLFRIKPDVLDVAQNITDYFIWSRDDGARKGLTLTVLDSDTWQTLLRLDGDQLNSTTLNESLAEPDHLGGVRSSASIISFSKEIFLNITGVELNTSRRLIILHLTSCRKNGNCLADVDTGKMGFMHEISDRNFMIVMLSVEPFNSLKLNFQGNHFLVIGVSFDLRVLNTLSLFLCGECTKGWLRYRSQKQPHVTSCYLTDHWPADRSWSEAKETCARHFSALTNLESEEELQFLTKHVESLLLETNSSSVHVGLTFLKTGLYKRWQWSNKRPWTVKLWECFSNITSYRLDQCWILTFRRLDPSNILNGAVESSLQQTSCTTRIPSIFICEQEFLEISAQYSALHNKFVPRQEEVFIKRGLANLPDQEFLFECGGGEERVHHDLVCDGQIHCLSGRDEDFCFSMVHKGAGSCLKESSGRSHFYTGILTKEMMCDGTQDCVHNEDEGHCFECLLDQCADGTCLPTMMNIHDRSPAWRVMRRTPH